MGLLEEIRDAAVNSDTDVGEVLRKCLVLAFELKNDKLRAWAEKELNGYGPDDELPAYRVVGAPSTGHFVGGYGRQLKDAPIPLGNLPEDLRERLSKLRLQQPVSTYAKMVKDGNDNSNLRTPWAPDIVAIFAERFYQDMNLLGAWQSFPVGALHSIVETVRSRVLGFVLQLRQEAPASQGDASKVAEQVPPERVTQMFQTIIYGTVSNLAVGSANVSQESATTIIKGDLESLKNYLVALGLEDSDADALEDTIRNDQPPTRKGEFGSRVGGWIGKMVAKAASGGWDIAAGAAGQLLAQAINAYYGLR